MPDCRAKRCRFKRGRWSPVFQKLSLSILLQFGNDIPLTILLPALPMRRVLTIAAQVETPGTIKEGMGQLNSLGNALHLYEAPKRLLLKEHSCSLFRGDYNVLWSRYLSVLSGMKSQRKHGDS